MAIRKRRWVFFYTPLILLILFLGALFTTGLPLNPILPLLRPSIEKMGWTLGLDSARVKAHLNGCVSLDLKDVRLGDSVLANAVSFSNLHTEWRMAGLFGLSAVPSLVELENCHLRLHLSPDGLLVVITPPAKTEADLRDAEANEQPFGIPEFAKPKEGIPLLFEIRDLSMDMPQQGTLPSIRYGYNLKGNLERKGEILSSRVDSRLSLDGNLFTTDTFALELNSRTLELNCDLGTRVELDTVFGKLLAGQSNHVSGALDIQAQAKGPLPDPEAFIMKANVSSEGLLFSGALFPHPFHTGPLSVRSDVDLRGTNDKGQDCIVLKSHTMVDEGALLLELGGVVEPERGVLDFTVGLSLKASETVRALMEAFNCLRRS